MKTALVFGAGLSGIGAAELLEKNDYKVYLIDDKACLNDKSYLSSEEGISILEQENIEFIVKSPGIPWSAQLLIKAGEKNVNIISEIDLAYRYMDKNVKVVSFTGTNGKTTTSTKMYEILKFAGEKAELAGNAGFSFAKLVADKIQLDYTVLELSSYQLENNPQLHSYIAGIINLTPDHLSRYESVEDYYTTKFNIFDNQTEDDWAIINLDDNQFLELYNNKGLSSKIKAKKVYISQEKKGTVFVHNGNIFVMKDLHKNIEEYESAFKAGNVKIEDIAEKIASTRELSLKGRHNLENMLFLIAAAKILNISNEIIFDFLTTTKSLEHRLENFFIKGNTTFINDSKGTNVESTLKAIDSFENKIILILGGDDKKVPNDELVKAIKEKVDFVYLIGVNAPILINDMEKSGYKNYKNLDNIENILNYLKENENFDEDKTILFSPATSSFCQFKNFEERGKIFKELTLKILGE